MSCLTTGPRTCNDDLIDAFGAANSDFVHMSRWGVRTTASPCDEAAAVGGVFASPLAHQIYAVTKAGFCAPS